MKCKLTREMPAGANLPEPMGTILPVGYVLDHPAAFRVVQMGCATPADEECRKRANMTQEAMDAADRAFPALEKGIVPEDRKAFFAGKMDGYNPDGSWKPGPNSTDEDVDDYDNEEFEEELSDE